MKTLTNKPNTVSTSAFILYLAMSFLTALWLNPVSAAEDKLAASTTYFNCLGQERLHLPCRRRTPLQT